VTESPDLQEMLATEVREPQDAIRFEIRRLVRRASSSACSGPTSGASVRRSFYMWLSRPGRGAGLLSGALWGFGYSWLRQTRSRVWAAMVAAVLVSRPQKV